MSWESRTHQQALEQARFQEREKQRARELYDFRRFHSISWPSGVDPDIIRASVPQGMTMQGTVRRLIALFSAKQIGKDAFVVLAQQQSPTTNGPDLGFDLSQFCNCPNCDGSHWAPPVRILQTLTERLEAHNDDNHSTKPEHQ